MTEPLISEHKILFVDDEQDVLDAFERRLRKNYNVVTACGGDEGLRKLKTKGPFAIIVSDMRMPKMTGLQLLSKVKQISPSIVRIMLTGNTDQKTAIDAVNQGEVFRFLTKPCGSKTLGEVLDKAIEEYERRTIERNMLNSTVKQIIQLLCSVLSQGDPKTWNRGLAAMRLLKQVTAKLEIEDCWSMEMAALLSQLGTIAVPWELRHKWEQGEKLTDEEQAIINKIPETGSNLIKSVPRMEEVANLVRYNGKYFDGSGYPEDDVKGSDIPLGASIIRLVFDFVEWQSKGKSNREVVKILKADSHLYDPDLIKSLEELFPGREGKVKANVASKKEEANVQYLKATELKVGMELAADLLATNGSIVIPKKTVIDEVCMNRIINFSRMGGLQEPVQVVG